VIIKGFAEIVLDKNLTAIYEKGMFFGELAISTGNPKRRATVKALSTLTLLEIPQKFYIECNLPAIMDDYYRLDNHFNRAVRPELVASLGFGSLTHWKKGQAIFSDLKGHKESVYLIISGKVKITTGQGKKIAFLSSGDIMGEISNWRSMTRSSDIDAYSDEVFAVELNQEQVSRLFKLYPSFHGTVYQKIKKLEARLTP
jgi:CRP-like cAMP-binding protein